MIFFYHILVTMKFELHLRNFSKVSKKAGCGGKIYVGIIRESSHICYGLILLMQGLF